MMRILFKDFLPDMRKKKFNMGLAWICESVEVWLHTERAEQHLCAFKTETAHLSLRKVSQPY